MAVEEFPVEHFFKEPLMLAPTLSPDGEYLAALTPYNINRETNSRCKNRPFGQKNSKGEFQEETSLSYTLLIKIKIAKLEIMQLVQALE